MGEVINLRRARKARDRAAAATHAARQRAAHGRTMAQRQCGIADQTRRDTVLNGAKLEDSEEPLNPASS